MARQISARLATPRSTTRLIPQRYVVVMLTFICTCVCYIERVGFSVAYTAAANSAGIKEVTKGLILSVFFYGYAMSQIPGGYVAQKLGGRRVLLMSFVLWSLTSALTPTKASTAGGLILARLLVGVAQGFIFPSIHTVLAQWVPFHERSRSVSLTTSGMYFGAAFGMLLLPGLVEKQGPRSVFLAEAAMGAAWALLWFLYAVDPPLSDHPKASIARFGPPPPTINPYISLSIEENGVLRDDSKKIVMEQREKIQKRGGIPWMKIMFSMPVWAIVVNNFTFHYVLYVLMNWLPTYFDQGLVVGLKGMGVFKMLPYLLMFVSSNVGGVVADHLITRRIFSVTVTRKSLNGLGFGISAIALLVMPKIRSVEGAVICSSLTLGACAFARAGFAVNHMDIAPRYAGIVMGFSNTAGTVAGVVGVAVTGHILERSKLGASDLSSWKLVFSIPAILCVLSGAFFQKFATGERLFE